MRAGLFSVAAVLAAAGCGSSASSIDAAATDASELGSFDFAGSSSDAAQRQNGVPPFGQSSGGSGGPYPVNVMEGHASGINFGLIVPSSYKPSTPAPLLVVYSGTEGVQQMTQNLAALGPSSGIGGFLCAVLDGPTYFGDGMAGATVLDAMRMSYNIDNDRTYLLGESAGTTAAFALGFHLREGFFAAYWANDINAVDGPGETAAQLGFAPWGQVGPGGQVAAAQQIVASMSKAGYRLPSVAPYAGPGSGSHGDPNQFQAALEFFPNKTRQ